MKKLALALLASLITSCGSSATENSNTKAGFSSPSTDSLIFSSDDRPVDGALIEINLQRQDSGLYNVSIRRAMYDRIQNREVDETSEIESNMTCNFGGMSIWCSRDLRPFDGQLTELFLRLESSSTAPSFTAELHTAFVDRTTGKDIDNTIELGTGLKPVPFRAETLPMWGVTKELRFVLDERSALGPFTEILLTRNDERTYDATIRTLTYRGAVVLEETKELGDRLKCETNSAPTLGSPVVMTCSRDNRIADGALIRLDFVSNGAGTFSATKTVELAPWSAPNPVPEVTNLGEGFKLEILD